MTGGEITDADIREVKSPAPTESGGRVHYESCEDAREAGAGPFLLGQPGYRVELDADRDGIACEWN